MSKVGKSILILIFMIGIAFAIGYLVFVGKAV